MYQLEIELEPTEIDSQKLYKATESNSNNKKDTKIKYITKERLGSIMKILYPEPKELDFVRKTVGLFRGEKIKIERK